MQLKQENMDNEIELHVHGLGFTPEMKDQAMTGIQMGCWKLSQNLEQHSEDVQNNH